MDNAAINWALAYGSVIGICFWVGAAIYTMPKLRDIQRLFWVSLIFGSTCLVALGLRLLPS
jgi:hypothetical protein